MKTEIEQRIYKIQDKINRLGIEKMSELNLTKKKELSTRIQSLKSFKTMLLNALEEHE